MMVLWLILGGSWVDISGVIGRVTIVITHIRGLITLRIATHQPLSMSLGPKPYSTIGPEHCSKPQKAPKSQR